MRVLCIFVRKYTLKKKPIPLNVSGVGYVNSEGYLKTSLYTWDTKPKSMFVTVHTFTANCIIMRKTVLSPTLF